MPEKIITIAEVRAFLKTIEGQEISLDKLRSELGIEKYDTQGKITKSFNTISVIVFRLEEKKELRWVGRGLYTVGQVTTSKHSATERPSAMEITPKTPYSNLLNLRQILRNCGRHIWYADRYFNSRGLEELIRTIDPALVREVRILSGPDNVDERAKRDFARFCEELGHKRVSAEWRVLKDFAHGRFIISESACFIVPSIDTIVRGQYSQILETPNRPPFDEWWKVAIPIRDYKP